MKVANVTRIVFKKVPLDKTKTKWNNKFSENKKLPNVKPVFEIKKTLEKDSFRPVNILPLASKFFKS